MDTITIATTQYETGTDMDENLRRVLERIDEAADNNADLVVFPEFINHAPLYRDQDHCWEVAVDAEGSWVGAIRRKAAERGVWVAFNAATRSDRPKVYDQNYLIDRTGTIVGTARKKVLIGGENDYMTRAYDEARVFDTELGRIGFYTCMDGVLPETPRTVALGGAQILINSLNSNARDEGSMHVPARAAENGVFVVSSCKSGPLVPLDSNHFIFQRMAKHLVSAPGESQIVDPGGNVLARGEFGADEIVYATIRPSEADSKAAPGTDGLFAGRRPDTYGVLLLPTEALPFVANPSTTAVEPFRAACITAMPHPNPHTGMLRGIDVVEEAADRGARLIVLPELFPFVAGTVTTDPAAAADLSEEVANRLAALAASRDLGICASLVERDGDRYYHTARFWTREGLAGSYRQIHGRADGWQTLGDRFEAFDTPFGRIGMMVGVDGLFVESARVLACLGADLILYPTVWRVAWEPRYALRERAAENHLTILAASRANAPVSRGSIIATVPRFPVPWRGRLNPSDLTESAPGEETFVIQTIDPEAARDKLILPQTDAIWNRRAELHGALATAPVPA